MATVLAPVTLTTAVTSTTSSVLQFRRGAPRQLTLLCIFTYGSGGTTADAYVQTSIDGGATWTDIANFHHTTASLTRIYNLSALTAVTTVYTSLDGTIANDTAKDGIIGTQIRVKYKSAGTYGGSTTIAVYATSSDLTA